MISRKTLKISVGAVILMALLFCGTLFNGQKHEPVFADTVQCTDSYNSNECYPETKIESDENSCSWTCGEHSGTLTYTHSGDNCSICDWVKTHSCHENDFAQLLPASGTLASGNYYLTADTTLTGTLTISSGTTVAICLNDHILTTPGTYRIQNSGTLTICDCGKTKRYFTYENDTLSLSENNAQTDIYLEGGYITGKPINNKDGATLKLHDVNFYGFSHSLDGGTILNSGTLTMDGCTFYGCSDTKHGGVIFQKNTALIENCTFKYNTAQNNGSVLYTNSDDVVTTIKNSVFTDNYASNGGVFYLNGGEITLLNCTITGNKAKNNGGAIYCDSTLTLGGTNLIYDNKVGDKQNNIYLYTGMIAIDSTTVLTGNTTKIGVCSRNGYGTMMTDCPSVDYKKYFVVDNNYEILITKVADNQYTYSIVAHACNDIGFNDILPTSGTLEDKDYYLSSDTALTGYLTIPAGTVVNICLNGNVLNLNQYYIKNSGILTIYDCGKTERYFTDTKALDCVTGMVTDGKDGCYETYSLETSEGALKIVGGVITGGWGNDKDDLAVSDGGAVYNEGTLTIKSGNIVGNITGEYGGAIYSTGSFVMDGGTIAGNHTDRGAGIYICSGTATINSGSIINNYSSGLGGGIFNYNAEIIINGGTISNNEAYEGGGIAISDGGTVTLNKGTVSDNRASSQGGGIYVYIGTFTMTGGSITDNTADQFGAGIYDGSTTNLLGGSITDNTVTCASGKYLSNYGCAGVYIAMSKTLTVGGDIVISGNKTNGESDNVVMKDKLLALSTETPLKQGASIGIRFANVFGEFLSGCASDGFKGYFSSDDGIGINVTKVGESEYNYSVEHVCGDIVYSKAFPEKGNLEKNTNYVLIKDMTLSETLNVTETIHICLNGHILNRNGITIVNNGTLYICDCGTKKTYFEYKDNLFTKTESQTSFFIEGGYVTGEGENSFVSNNGGATYITDVDFYNCTGMKKGIINSFGTLNVTGSKFIHCTSTDNGGAIYTTNTATIADSAFYGCSSAGKGGGVFSQGNTLMTNCIFEYNTALQGGAIYNENSGFLTVIDVTIQNNTATDSGAGIYCYSLVTDCLVAGTLISMADGTTKKIEDIMVGDLVKTFDHETGKVSSEKVYLAYKGSEKKTSVTLNFTNGIKIGIVDCHDFFEKSTMKYVTIHEENAKDFIGKYFYNATYDRWEQLSSVSVNANKADYYTLYTAHHLNSIANDMLTVADDVDYLLNIFEFDNELKINQEKKQADIEKYGLCPYEDIKDYVSEEYYDCLLSKYIYIAIGKGLISYEEACLLCNSANDYMEKQGSSPKMAASPNEPEITPTTFKNDLPSEKSYIIIGKNVTVKNNKVGQTENNIYLVAPNSYIYVIKDATDIDAGITLSKRLGDFAIYCDSEKYMQYFVSDVDITDADIYSTKVENNNYTYSIAHKCGEILYNTLLPQKDALSGNYCLLDDTVLTGNLTIAFGTTVRICLNGHILNLGTYTITNKGTLIICDCKTNKTYFEYKNDALSKTETQTDMYLVGGYLTGRGQIQSEQYATLSLNNVAFYDCVYSYGGVLYNNGGIMTVKDSQFVLCKADNTGAGGAIYNEDGTLSVDTCKFYGCSAKPDGGAIYNCEMATIKNSTFLYCSSQGAGGAIGCYNDSKTVTNISDCIISHCTSNKYGGAVCVDENSVLTLIGCTITDNTATSFGGGLEIMGDVTITDCTISNNTSPCGAGIDYTCGSLTLGGATVIYDNLYNEKQNNLYVYEEYIALSTEKPLKKGASIGVILDSDTGVFVSGIANITDMACFSADDTTYALKAREIAESNPKTYTYGVEEQYTVTYNKNNATSGTAPSDTTKYFADDSVTLAGNTGSLVKTGYKFLGWAKTSSATEALTSYSVLASDATSGVITLYAVWKSMKYDSDIIVTITTLEYGVKESDISICVDDTDLTVLESDLFYAGKTAMEYPEKIEKSGTYYIAFVLKSTEGYYFGGEKTMDPYEEDINKKFASLFKKTITIEGSNMLAGYGCKTYDMTNAIFYSDITDQTEIIEVNNQYLFVMVLYSLPGYTVTYDENAGTDTVTGMPSDTTEYLEKAPVTVSTDTPTRAGYKFLGWNTDETATTALTFTNGKFDMGDENVTLYAIWEEKTAVTITETAQTPTYDGTAQSFDIVGSTLTGFTVKYYVGSDWTETAPTDAGTYNVKVTRAEDDNYAGFSKEITGGLIIDKSAVSEPTVGGIYTYTGKEQTVSLNGVESYMSTESSFVGTNVGDYAVVYTLDSNHKWADGSDGNVTWSIAKAQAVINVNTTPIVKTFGETVIIPTATSNFGKVQCDKVAQNLVNAGSYEITYTVLATDNYEGDQKKVSVQINQMNENEPSVIGTYRYNGKAQTAMLSGIKASMTTSDSLTQTNAGTYTICYTLDNNHAWADGSDGEVIWVIEKAVSVINLNTDTIKVPFGEMVVLPTALSNRENVLCDTKAIDLTQVGEYTVTYYVEETDNYTGAEKTLTVIIEKEAVQEPSVVGVYKYTGKEQTVILNGLEEFMSIEGISVASEVGVYTVIVTLDDNHIWADGSDGILTWEIKATALTPKSDESTEQSKEEKKQTVIVETEDGFTSDITLEVVVVVESTVIESVEKKELIVDYYNLSDKEIALTEDEAVGVVYDVKLIQTIDGVTKEIQPEDIAPGTRIKVRMLIPEVVDITKLTRILHVHSADDIEEYVFDPSKMDENGYYEIEIDRLSEFAFIYYEKHICINHWYMLIGLAVMIFLLLVAYASLRQDDQKRKRLALIIDFICFIALIVGLFFIGCKICIIVYAVSVLIYLTGIIMQVGKRE